MEGMAASRVISISWSRGRRHESRGSQTDKLTLLWSAEGEVNVKGAEDDETVLLEARMLFPVCHCSGCI